MSSIEQPSDDHPSALSFANHLDKDSDFNFVVMMTRTICSLPCENTAEAAKLILALQYVIQATDQPTIIKDSLLGKWLDIKRIGKFFDADPEQKPTINLSLNTNNLHELIQVFHQVANLTINLENINPTNFSSTPVNYLNNLVNKSTIEQTSLAQDSLYLNPHQIYQISEPTDPQQVLLISLEKILNDIKQFITIPNADFNRQELLAILQSTEQANIDYYNHMAQYFFHIPTESNLEEFLVINLDHSQDTIQSSFCTHLTELIFTILINRLINKIPDDPSLSPITIKYHTKIAQWSESLHLPILKNHFPPPNLSTSASKKFNLIIDHQAEEHKIQFEDFQDYLNQLMPTQKLNSITFKAGCIDIINWCHRALERLIKTTKLTAIHFQFPIEDIHLPDNLPSDFIITFPASSQFEEEMPYPPGTYTLIPGDETTPSILHSNSDTQQIQQEINHFLSTNY